MEKIAHSILSFFKTPYGLFLVGILMITLWVTTAMKQEGFASGGTASPGSYSFVMYYAPWCPHCKSALGPFEIAGGQSEVGFARINGDEFPEVGFLRYKLC